MRFESLSVSNFRGIAHFEIENLRDIVVIAGPNGAGKSVALDAIRLLKSAYGGYQQNESSQWFGEFQINLSRPDEFKRIMRRDDQPLRVEATIRLADEERDYLAKNAEAILEAQEWLSVSGYPYLVPGLVSQLRQFEKRIEETVSIKTASLKDSIKSRNTYQISLQMGPDLKLVVSESPVIELLFSHYNPRHLGVIDYHSASRSYQRESLGGINLSLESFEERLKNTALYNSQSKYQNIKGELAADYLRSLIAKEANAPSDHQDLNETLKELFQIFFPNKHYDGPLPKADGSLEFPVTLSTGEVHDIDELSSGEKEIVYGYLRLRTSAPRNSVILLDEPELHLNPGLLQGFPDFYHRHLGVALGNQIWMTTHSDALLRQAIGNDQFSVYQMRPATAVSEGNQAVPIGVDGDLEQAVIDLVGDLATYKPQADIVIMEGSGPEFDVMMLSRLAPEFARSVNLISGGGKRRVGDLYNILAEASQRASLKQKFFAVVDRDRVIEPTVPNGVHVWDRYHIENYLLEPRFVLEAIREIDLSTTFTTEEQVMKALQLCASEVSADLVLEELQATVNKQLVGSLKIGAPPRPASASGSLRPSIVTSSERFVRISEELLNSNYLETLESEIRVRVQQALASDRWMYEIPGRPILSLFVDRHKLRLNYEIFRNLVLARMVEAKFCPSGISEVIEKIKAASSGT